MLFYFLCYFDARMFYFHDVIRVFPGFFLEPAVFTDVQDGMFIATEESFGPVMIISKFKDGYA